MIVKMIVKNQTVAKNPIAVKWKIIVKNPMAVILKIVAKIKKIARLVVLNL